MAMDSDRLSALPSEIQAQILSFLPTTDAAKVCFTSKTWWSRWSSISQLIFRHDQFPGTFRTIGDKCDAFVRFVDHTLACHDKSGIHVFELWLWRYIGYSIPIYVRWIRFAIAQNVQKLVLFGKMARRSIKIPDCVFSCPSIVKLELAIEGCALTWPKTCALPNLRKLKLKFLVFNQASQHDFFSCCPALEKLSICFCDLTSFETLAVIAPKLNEFMMCNCPGMDECSLSFRTAGLSKFIYISSEPSDIILVPTQLFGLVISEQRVDVKYKSTNDLTSSVLKVTRELFKALSMAHDLQRQLAVDVFCNVKRLLIHLQPRMTNVRTVLLLISRCVFISVVNLELEGSSSETVEFPELDLNLINLSYNLVTNITVGNFGGSDIELTLIKVLLANARMLKLMRIDRNMLMVSSDTLLEKTETILEYEKASPFADVIFD